VTYTPALPPQEALEVRNSSSTVANPKVRQPVFTNSGTISLRISSQGVRRRRISQCTVEERLLVVEIELELTCRLFIGGDLDYIIDIRQKMQVHFLFRRGE
jgi:hypothetical protein